jgi:hypothetical protein
MEYCFNARCIIPHSDYQRFFHVDITQHIFEITSVGKNIRGGGGNPQTYTIGPTGISASIDLAVATLPINCYAQQLLPDHRHQASCML